MSTVNFALATYDGGESPDLIRGAYNQAVVKIDTLLKQHSDAIGTLETDSEDVTEAIDDLGDRVTTLETEVHDLATDVTELNHLVGTYQDRIEALEQLVAEPSTEVPFTTHMLSDSHLTGGGLVKFIDEEDE